MISGKLTEAGYEVMQAASGSDALTMVEKNPPFDLITLDLEMDDLDGFAVCQMIRTLEDETKAETPVVFLTGKDTLENREKGMKIGAADFLIKSKAMDLIHKKVNQILNPSHSLAGLRAMVVEDSRSSRLVIKGALQEHSVLVTDVCDAEAAVQNLMSGQTIDLIITDQNLPGMSGTRLTEIIRTDLGMADIPVIMISAAMQNPGVLEFFDAGGTDCLHQPFIKEELMARLRVHLEDQQKKKQLRDTIAKLEAMDKAKDDYLAACSHDLKSPLSSIIGFTELVIEESSDDQTKEDLTRVLASGRVLAELIDNILEINRIQSEFKSMDLQPIRLGDIAKKSVELNQGLADRKGVQLEIKGIGVPHEATVNGNELGLTRVVNNLISNALKFTPKGGTVRVVLELQIDSNRLLVEDTGIGMDTATRRRLFRRFTKASRTGTSGEAGTGLGLSIARDIIDNHKGTITVESEVNKGSRFIVELPLAGALPAAG